MIKISIVVPVYKVEPYIRECIDSILRQRWKNYELILVDDGSPDSCGKICEEYQKKDGRIRVIHKENGGLSDARNRGIEAAAGEYITFIDSDDAVSDDYLALLAEAAEKYRADIVQGEKTRIADRLGTITGKGEERFSGEEAFRQSMLWGRTEVLAWAKLYKRELFETIRYPKGRINEDSCTAYQFFLQSETVVCIPDVIYYYRVTPESIMSRKIGKERFEVLRVPDEITAYLGSRADAFSEEIEYYRMRLGLNLYHESYHGEKTEETLSARKELCETLQKISRGNRYLNLKYQYLLFLLRFSPKLYDALLKFRKKRYL